MSGVVSDAEALHGAPWRLDRMSKPQGLYFVLTRPSLAKPGARESISLGYVTQAEADAAHAGIEVLRRKGGSHKAYPTPDQLLAFVRGAPAAASRGISTSEAQAAARTEVLRILVGLGRQRASCEMADAYFQEKVARRRVAPRVGNLLDGISACIDARLAAGRISAKTARTYHVYRLRVAEHIATLYPGLTHAPVSLLGSGLFHAIMERDAFVPRVTAYATARLLMDAWRWLYDDADRWPGTPPPPRDVTGLLPVQPSKAKYRSNYRYAPTGLDRPPHLRVGAGDTTLYFIGQADGEGPIKVGISVHPAARLASVQTGHPARLAIYLTVIATRETERTLHHWLSDHRTSGEWFERAAALHAMHHVAKLAGVPCEVTS